MRSVITARISVLCVPHRHASGLTLVPYLEPSIVKSHTPRERHGTPRNRPTRTGRQQQAPNKQRAVREPGQQRQPSRGQGTRGPRSIGLFLLMRLCAGGGGRRDVDAGLPMDLWLGAGMQADVAWGLGMACSYALGCFGTFGGRYLSVPYGFRGMPDL